MYVRYFQSGFSNEKGLLKDKKLFRFPFKRNLRLNKTKQCKDEQQQSPPASNVDYH